MTRDQLVREIISGLTASYALPVALSDGEVERLIIDAERWFFVNYNDAVETKQYMVPAEEFKTAEFKTNRYIKLPDCVVSVYEVREIRGGNRLGSIDKDFSDNKMIAAEIYLSANAGDNLMFRTAQLVYYDLAKALFLDHIRYDYNRNTKKLQITGRNPELPVYLATYVKIPSEDLYEDPYFISYVRATGKIALGGMLSLYQFTLPGGATINGDALKQEGQQELTDLKQRIDDENAPGWFNMFN
jgi:hypothetical protein